VNVTGRRSANGGRGEVQCGELVRQQAGVAQVVLVLGDPVCGLGQLVLDDLDGHERDAHLAQVFLVALEGAVVRDLVLGVPGHLRRDLHRGEGPRRLEQRGREVQQPLELLGRPQLVLRPTATR
jgi:hypothetical protein